MIVTVIPNTSESVDEVISPRFLFLSFPQLWTTNTLLTYNQIYYEKTFITLLVPDDSHDVLCT